MLARYGLLVNENTPLRPAPSQLTRNSRPHASCRSYHDDINREMSALRNVCRRDHPDLDYSCIARAAGSTLSTRFEHQNVADAGDLPEMGRASARLVNRGGLSYRHPANVSFVNFGNRAHR